MENLKIENNAGEVVIFLNDKVDAHNYTDIQAQATKYISDTQGITSVTFDLSSTLYVSSAGLRMFSALNKICQTAGISYKLINLSADIIKMFKLTGYSSIYTIEESIG